MEELGAPPSCILRPDYIWSLVIFSLNGDVRHNDEIVRQFAKEFGIPVRKACKQIDARIHRLSYSYH
jgi:hypothetical protein